MNLVTVIYTQETDKPTYGVDFSFLTDFEISIYEVTLDNYRQIIDNIPTNSFIINLCDGNLSENTPGIEVVLYLEEKKRIFTGSSSKSYNWNKSKIKNNNIMTPKFAIINKNNINELITLTQHLKYPLFVKPDNIIGGSNGISKDSLVLNINDLDLKLKKMILVYENIMIEEYIDGREFTVLVCHNGEKIIVLEPIECIFTGNEKFKHYDLKWKDYNDIKINLNIEHDLQTKIMNFAKEAYTAFDLDSYIRFDIRMDNNNLYIIDVNPYCAIFYKPEYYGCADIILKNSKKMNHCDFVLFNFIHATNRYSKFYKPLLN